MLAALALAAGAQAAPLRVTLTATGDAAAYAWDLGDGTFAAGAVVSHVYPAGRHVATVTATNEAGETAQAQVVVTATARTLTLSAPPAGDYDGPAVLSGTLRPARAGAKVQLYRGRTHVTTAITRAGGRWRAVIRHRAGGRVVATKRGGGSVSVRVPTAAPARSASR